MRITRPTLVCEEVYVKAAQLMLSAMGVPEDEQSLDDMVEALKEPGEVFEGLKSLEYNSWIIRDQDIQVFMAKENYRVQALKDVTRDWVARHRILPQCEVGQEVKVKGEQGMALAIISEVLQADGMYRAHFTQSSDREKMASVPYEAVHDLAQPAEAFQLMAG